MSALEEVKNMQQQGLQESEIISNLQQKGVSYKNISDALAQSKIKAAVEQPPYEPQTQVPQATPPQDSESTFPESPSASQSFQNQNPQYLQNQQASPNPGGQVAGMQQSIMQTEPQEPQEQTMPEYNQSFEDPYNNNYDNQGNYGQYEYASSAISPDTITEISEQIISERLVEIRKKLEQTQNFKTTFETKTEALEDRIKRIEKIIDDLQSSVLRKVGDYVTNISDIKKELIETQKSFSKLSHANLTAKTKHTLQEKKKKKKKK